MRLFLGWSRRRIEIRSGEEQFVRFGIDLHRLGPVLSVDGLNLAQFVGRVFVENVDLAFAG